VSIRVTMVAKVSAKPVSYAVRDRRATRPLGR
jgi:hypothetical protein